MRPRNPNHLYVTAGLLISGATVAYMSYTQVEGAPTMEGQRQSVHVASTLGSASLPGSLAALVHQHPATNKALSALWNVYEARTDLQKAFPENTPDFAAQLLGWAIKSGTTSDAAKKQLLPFLRSYEVLFAEKQAGDSRKADSAPDSAVEVPMNSFLRALGVSDDNSLKALNTLWQVYRSRPDLQKEFPTNSPTFISSLLQWSVNAGITVDAAREKLGHYAAGYRSILITLQKSKKINTREIANAFG